MIHLLQRAAELIEAEGGFTSLPPMDEEEDRLRTHIATLLEREKCHARRDYLNYVNENGHRSVGAVDAACRARACRWMFRVARGAGLKRETAVVAIGYMDGFLCSSSPRARRARVVRRDFMLVAMTCLCTAIGAREPARRDIDASLIDGLSKGLLSARDIDECEREILLPVIGKEAPTALQLLKFIVKLLPASLKYGAVRRIVINSYRQIEASTMDYACVILRQSTIAVVSVLNLIERMPEDAFTPDERVAFVERMSGAFLIDVVSPLIKAVRRRLIRRGTRRPGVARVVTPAVVDTPPQTARCAGGKRTSVEDSPVCVIGFREMP